MPFNLALLRCLAKRPGPFCQDRFRAPVRDPHRHAFHEHGSRRLWTPMNAREKACPAGVKLRQLPAMVEPGAHPPVER
jgi:hypothetical protein